MQSDIKEQKESGNDIRLPVLYNYSEKREISYEWLPSCKAYKLAGNYNIEMYAPPCENPEENYSEIRVPVEKA